MRSWHHRERTALFSPTTLTVDGIPAALNAEADALITNLTRAHSGGVMAHLLPQDSHHDTPASDKRRLKQEADAERRHLVIEATTEAAAVKRMMAMERAERKHERLRMAQEEQIEVAAVRAKEHADKARREKEAEGRMRRRRTVIGANDAATSNTEDGDKVMGAHVVSVKEERTPGEAGSPRSHVGLSPVLFAAFTSKSARVPGTAGEAKRFAMRLPAAHMLVDTRMHSKDKTARKDTRKDWLKALNRPLSRALGGVDSHRVRHEVLAKSPARASFADWWLSASQSKAQHDKPGRSPVSLQRGAVIQHPPSASNAVTRLLTDIGL